jgi:hypothetical protein
MRLRRSDHSKLIDPRWQQPRHVTAVNLVERSKPLVRVVAPERDPIAIRHGSSAQALIVDKSGR